MFLSQLLAKMLEKGQFPLARLTARQKTSKFHALRYEIIISLPRVFKFLNLTPRNFIAKIFALFQSTLKPNLSPLIAVVNINFSSSVKAYISQIVTSPMTLTLNFLKQTPPLLYYYLLEQAQQVNFTNTRIVRAFFILQKTFKIRPKLIGSCYPNLKLKITFEVS